MFTDGINEFMLLNAPISKLSKSGNYAAMSSALTSYTILYYIPSDGMIASGAASILGRFTSILKLIESSLGYIPCYA
jgi:hypothetical protein